MVILGKTSTTSPNVEAMISNSCSRGRLESRDYLAGGPYQLIMEQPPHF